MEVLEDLVSHVKKQKQKKKSLYYGIIYFIRITQYEVRANAIGRILVILIVLDVKANNIACHYSKALIMRCR